METEQELSNESMLDLIDGKIKIIKEFGFGEVRIIIRNGAVYRIISIRDELIEESK